MFFDLFYIEKFLILGRNWNGLFWGIGRRSWGFVPIVLTSRKFEDFGHVCFFVIFINDVGKA